MKYLPKYIFLLLSLHILLQAQWTADSSVNTQVSPFGMSPIVTDDGDGGAIVFFYDGTSTRAYIQRIDKYGYKRWNNGSPVKVGGYLKNQNPKAICADGFGGAYLQYTETDKTNPPDTGKTLVFTNRIDSTGKLLWNGTIGIDLGLELFNGSQPWRFNDYDIPFYKIASSQKNGYWYAWVDSAHPAGENNKKLKIQRITPSGSKIFGEYGLFVTSDVVYDVARDIIGDNYGGVYVATAFKIFHFDSTGNSFFPDSGVYASRLIQLLDINKKKNTLLYPSAQEVLPNLYNYYLTALDSLGNLLWESKIFDSLDIRLGLPSILVDDGGSINLFWLHQFTGGNYIISFLKIDETGIYDANLQKEIVIENENTSIEAIQSIMNDSNSIIIIWGFGGDNINHNFKTLRIDSIGNALWSQYVSLSSRETDQGYIRAVNQNQGGIIVIWYEIGARNGIYAQQINRDGKLGQVTAVDYMNAPIIPSRNYLKENYPNPFNPSTRISYQISSLSDVALDVYDILGRKIENLVHQLQGAGNYSVVFNAQPLPSGIYICRLTAGNYSKTIKMILLK